MLIKLKITEGEELNSLLTAMRIIVKDHVKEKLLGANYKNCSVEFVNCNGITIDITSIDVEMEI